MTNRRTLLLLGIVAGLSACQASDHAPSPADEPKEATDSVTAPPSVHLNPDKGETPEARPIAQELILREWSKAENRDECAPIGFTKDGGASADPRRASFAGGWAVAFDTPDLRSAYGVAGPGIVPADRADAQTERLRDQWPYFMQLPDLPQPSFAGYGIEGAQPYPAENPEGRGMNSLAYVRIGGQGCTYNLWSRLGRAHLELLLNSLRILPVDHAG